MHLHGQAIDHFTICQLINATATGELDSVAKIIAYYLQPHGSRIKNIELLLSVLKTYSYSKVFAILGTLQ